MAFISIETFFQLHQLIEPAPVPFHDTFVKPVRQKSLERKHDSMAELSVSPATLDDGIDKTFAQGFVI